MHSTSNLEDDYIGSGKRLWYSIRKHGRENHSREILEYCTNRKELAAREKEIVNEKFIANSMCMNLSYGGEGGFINKESARKGALATNEKARTDPEFRLRMETIRKNGRNEGLKRCYELRKEGKLNNGFAGKKHTEEYRKERSEMMKIAQKGENNSQYGKKWMYHSEKRVSETVRLEDTEKRLRDGWKFGRKLNFVKNNDNMRT
jgi:hypothetical protein